MSKAMASVWLPILSCTGENLSMTPLRFSPPSARVMVMGIGLKQEESSLISVRGLLITQPCAPLSTIPEARIHFDPFQIAASTSIRGAYSSTGVVVELDKA